MVFHFLTTFWDFFISIIRYKLNWKKGNIKLYYCGESFYKPTYRFPNKSATDIFIALRIYKRIFSAILKRSESIVKFGYNNGNAIFDENLNGATLRFDFVEKFSGIKNDICISKKHVLNYSGSIITIYTCFFMLFSFFPVLLLSLFSKNKLHYPMMLLECLECIYLLHLLHSYKIKTVHYFCIYERDANISAYILMKKGFFVNKIPSEVPLYFFNRIIIADQLSFCFSYQFEEFEHFKQTMFVNRTETWGPEQILNVPKRFFARDKNLSPAFDIGFFSSGNYMRERMGDVNLGHNEKENEQLLLQKLIDLSRVHGLKLRIFLHPNEKCEENKLYSASYYAKILDNNTYISLAPVNKPSIEGFDEINLGIALYSTLMFERLFLGFKTLLVPWGYSEFPLPTSTFKNICITSEKELSEKLFKNLNLTTKDFFTQNKVTNLQFTPATNLHF